ncbi:MAG: alpha/beta hydrolase [Myxococcales bacterium]|nr:alpha/beta hydrolase [Myxococcales bacterium]
MSPTLQVFARARGPVSAWVSSPAGPARGTLLCLHGFPDGPSTFEAFHAHFAPLGWRVVAPWLRGFSPASAAGPFDLDTLADDVLDLAAALEPDAPVHLIGHDWGAAVACTAATRNPRRVARLVMLGCPHPMAFIEHLLRSPEQLRMSWYMGFFQLPWAPEWALRRGLVSKLWRAWSPRTTPPSAHLAEVEAAIAASLPGAIAAYRAMVWPPGPALRRVLEGARGRRKVAVDTLLMQGADDACIAPESGARAAAHHTGRFEHLVIADAGHFLHLEAPAAVISEITRWIDEPTTCASAEG